MERVMDDIEKQQHDIAKANEELAFAKGRKVFFEHYRKVKRSILMKKYEPNYPTAASQEREALADPEYLDVLKSLEHWTGEYEIKYLTRKDLELKFSAWQTRHADARSERARYGA